MSGALRRWPCATVSEAQVGIEALPTPEALQELEGLLRQLRDGSAKPASTEDHARIAHMKITLQRRAG